MDRRRAAGVLLALAACVAYATAAPTASNHTSLDIYDGAPDGCYYNFQHYGEGDRIMTNEPCLNCTCHNRMLMCYLRVCPFTKAIGQDCTIEKRADQCCPIVTCPDVPVDLLTSTTTSPAEYGATGLGKLDKFGCSIHGKYFPEGSKVPPTPNKPCEHCYCIRNMTTCVMQECTLHVDGCTPIYHKDVCCPVRYSCDHPEDEMPLLDDLSTTVRPTPGFLLTTTTLSPVTQMSQDCLYENQVIRDGALIKTEKACDHCYCMKGDIVCVVQECGTPMENEGKNCTALAPREGVCCPDTYICEGDEPTTSTYETDYTAELEKLTTLTPPRRSESEGSGYRKETDGVPVTEIPSTETETEGSGYQATIHPTILTEAPESHKIESSDETLSSTTVKESDNYDVTTESELQKDTESHYVSSTTSAYVSQQVDESLSTKAQDEDIGSGEEDIITPHEAVPTSSAPAVEDHEPTVSSEQNAFTSDATEVNDSEILVKATTTSTPTEVEDKIDISNEQSIDNVVDVTTSHSLGEDEDVETSTFDDEYKFTEHDNLQTTNIPIVEESAKKTTESSEQDKKTSEPHHYATPPTSAPGFEDDTVTTEPQDTATDSFEGTVPDFDDHHHMTVTASTPLLEEIEKDTTDQEIIRDDSTPDVDKISMIASNIPTEESINKDSIIPDVIDETIATNIPTTVSTFEDDVVRIDDEQITKETTYEDSSEPQQYSPTTITSISGDETESTLYIESITTSKSQESQDTSENLDHRHDSTASIPVLEDKTKETTSLDDVTTSKFDERPETSVEHSSEPQQHSPTTSGPGYDDESKETTQIGVTAVKESSEPQKYGSTTIAAILDDETKISTPSDATTSKTQEGQQTSIEDSSEPQQYAPSTRNPLIDNENKETTFMTPEDQEMNVKDVSDSQYYVPTTNASMLEDGTKTSTPMVLDSETIASSGTPLTTNVPVFENESKKTTPSDDLTTSKAQEEQKVDTNDSSESNQNAPITSAPIFEDEIKKTTLSDVLLTTKGHEDQKTDVIDSSESNQYAPTTIGLIFEDESKLTTPSDFITTTRTQDGQTQKYIPTTSASTFKDESKETTILGFEETSTIVSEFEDKTKETSSEITVKQNEITTTEPDKGLNTIPSGSVEEETTESPGVTKHTHTDEVIPIESATEQGTKLFDVTELIVDKADHTILETSASPEDLLTQSTESTMKEIIYSSTKIYDISEQTTVVPAEVTEGELSTLTHDRQPSTKHPATEYQESSTSTLPFNTGADTEKPIATSSYESSPQTTSSQSSEQSQTVTSSPSSTTVSVSTATDLEENEISNESRIPGEGDCLLNGVTYKNESAVPSTNKCQSGCRCSSSIIKCDPIICSPPPEYMDNCQTTYDSLDSCCPTYVCDHKTETMPPQSHSQMSGTEAPVESPIKCAGDECILNEDNKETVATSELCDSGSCSEQAESDTHPINVPEQPAGDRKEECTGSLCRPDSNECSQENGCQTAPVKPCEGIECEVSSETYPPQKQQPCIGDSCDIPVRDCSTGKCDDENKHDIEKECTEKSCKRKEISEFDQQPPKCSGSECPLTETTSEIELTTVGTLEVETEKVEETSQPSATDAGFNEIDDSKERVTEAVILSESESTTALPNKSTKLPEQESNKDEVSTSHEFTTPNVYSTDKIKYDVTFEADESYTKIPDMSIDDKSTVYVSPEITTGSPKIHTSEKDDFTKVPLESDSQDITTLSSQEQKTTQPPEKHVHEDISTSISDETTSKISISQEVDKDAMSTELPGSSDSIPYDTTKLPVDTNEENTVAYDSDDVTKLPQVSEEITSKASEDIDTTSKITKASEDSTTQIADIIGTEMSKPHSTDLQETTEIPKDSQSEETSVKTTDEFVTQTEILTTTVPSRANTEIVSESYLPVDSEKTQDTQSPDTIQSEMTTITNIEVVKAEPPKPFEPDVPEVTKSSEESYSKETTPGTDKEIDTQTLKPYDTQSQETTLSSEKTESAEITKIPTVTEPSPQIEDEIVTKSPVAIDFTRTDSTSPVSEKELSKGDEILHITVAPQQDTEADINKIEDAVTESAKPFEPEFVSTTKSSLADSQTQETTAKIEIGTDMESTKSDEMESQTVTKSEESVSVPLLDVDVTTIKSSGDDQENTTPQPVIVSELTTQSILVPDSKITETGGPDDNEIITRIQEPTESVMELATESLEKATSTSSESSSVKEDDMTSISHHEITTESFLDLTTMPLSYSEVTASSEKPDKLYETTSVDIHSSSSVQTVTEHPIEKEKEIPTDINKTTVSDLTEDAKTQVTDIVETEKDTMIEQTTSKPGETTDLPYNVDKKPEQTEPIDSHEELPAEPSRTTTESVVLETKLPDGSEVEPESQTDKPFIHKDESNSETPLSNEITTVVSEEKTTENPIYKVEEPKTTQYYEIKPTEFGEEMYTKTPLPVSSEGKDKIIDDELTTPAIKISEQTTESGNLFTNAPTESFSLQNVDTEITQKEPLDTEVTEQAETTPDTESLPDKETQTMVPDLSSEQESSTKEPLPTVIVKLTTESPKYTYPESLDESGTTAKPVYTETVTEFVEVTQDVEEKIPEKEFKPATTASEEQMTEAQDQGDSDNVATEKGITTESTQVETTKAPVAIETGTKVTDINTSPPEEAVGTSTSKHELSESTTVAKVEDEIAHKEKETTETPTTVSDQQTIGIVTELEPVVIDTTTKKQDSEQDFIPSKTERPEMYPTSLSATEEPAKLTPLPTEEVSTGSDQPITDQPITSESNASEEDRLTTNVAFDVEKSSTPKTPEIEVQTEKVITPVESSIQPEPSPVTTAPEEEKLTTAREVEKQTTAKAEEFTTAYPVFDKFTKTTHKPTDAPATEQPKPIPTEEQSTDDILPPDEEPSVPPSGYGTDPDYMEEDQTFGPGTCRYGGKVYVSAQQIPRDDPCDFCFCFRSDIICLQQSCPPPIHGCHEEPISGFCCPRYECPVSMATTVNVTTTTTTTTTTVPPHFPVHSYKGSAQKRGCLIKGHTYKVGEVVRASSGPCLHCTCGGDGQMKCDPKQCTPEPMLRQMIAAAVSAKRRR